MADRYIDNDETQIYGPWAVRQLRQRAVGLVPAFDAGMEYLASTLEGATAAMATAIVKSREAGAAHRLGASGKRSPLTAGRGLLGRFSRHLDGHPAGTLDRRTYFTTDGTAGGVGTSAAKVLLAVVHIKGELDKETCPVRDRLGWRDEFAAVMEPLGNAVEFSANANVDRGDTTPELETVRAAWLATYIAAKAGAECVLRLTGRLDRLPLIFFDLTVASRAKVTAPPPEPVDEPDEVDEASEMDDAAVN